MAQSKHLKYSNLIDRLSELPDNIIYHILGFLSTKCVVATCVLSQKWEYKWLNVRVLDLTDLPSENSDGTFHNDHLVCFKNFMNRVLLLNEASCLERLGFVAYDCLPFFNAKEWIHALARPSVKELYLSNKGPVFIRGPPKYLLAKEELVVLNLERLYLGVLSCLIHLPCLRIFSLEKVEFDDEEVVEDPFATILCNCPILEDLNIDRCTGFVELSGISSSLKTLKLISCEKRKIKVTIKASNLESLYLSIGMKQSLVDDFPSLVEARVEV